MKNYLETLRAARNCSLNSVQKMAELADLVATVPPDLRNQIENIAFAAFMSSDQCFHLLTTIADVPQLSTLVA